MSNRELAIHLIDQVPENKLLYAVTYLQGLIVPDEAPSAETLESVEKANKTNTMIANGVRKRAADANADFFKSPFIK